MEKIIKAAVERGASDLHIKAGDVFRARINGKLVPLTKQRLTPEQTRTIALKLMSSDEDRARIDHVTATGELAQKLLKLVESLDDHDDVQKVHANFEIPEEELAALQG